MSACSDSIPRYIIDCCNPIRRPEPKKKMRKIEITPMDSGFIVKIDCQNFAIETKESLIKKLSAYIMNPDEVENDWMGKAKLPKK